jgi:hypothetical protein
MHPPETEPATREPHDVVLRLHRPEQVVAGAQLDPEAIAEGLGGRLPVALGDGFQQAQSPLEGNEYPILPLIRRYAADVHVVHGADPFALQRSEGERVSQDKRHGFSNIRKKS